MQFVKNGPDIPETLLQAHEDGRVVFFCGAGISYPARLPGFSGLVKGLFDAMGEVPNPVQQAAIKAGQFDTAIGLLESTIVGGRETVRRALAGILTPDLCAPNATATHEALLTLGKTRDKRIRLITTNFDRLFEEVIATKHLAIERFSAPLLPIPKNRWDGLVYLHGCLAPAPTSSELDRLIVSSGDFGLAYLTERWAARFVSELFRNYTVCFVGYSINDPVLRYMMDALAADRLLGESSPEMFAFGSHSKGQEAERANEWRAKNVTPILYRVHNHHSYLHKTLRAWAATYRDGVGGKERIVVECAMGRPLASTKQDDFVGRLLWALSDPQGLPASRFADLDPVPSLEWLEPLSDERHRHGDLIRFGVTPQPVKDDKLAFSVVRRPAPYARAPWMTLVDGGSMGSQWDAVMRHLARWLTRHLDDPALVILLAKRGGQLHDNFAWWIQHQIDEIAKLERDGKHAELNRMRAAAPNAIPRPMLRTLWRLILTGRLKSYVHRLDLYGWISRFKSEGISAALRMELREILTPRVSLREPLRREAELAEEGEPERLKDLVNWDIVLTADHVHSRLRDLPKDLRWQSALPDLLADFSLLLRDALDLMRELEGVQEKSDLSYLYQPSISEHPQNKDFRDWTALIELTRDAWLATAAVAPSRARLAAENWCLAPYPLFKRLAYFAATQESVVPTALALDWLLADDGWWLWSVETGREAMRLLVAMAPRLDAGEIGRLEQAIMLGPPRDMYKNEIEPERWIEILERKIWLRLAKLAEAGAKLGQPGLARLDQLSTKHSQWKIAADERDEFSSWMSSGDEWRQFVATPRLRRDLAEWLKQHPSIDHWQKDDWRQRCSDDFATTACVLFALTRDGIWPTERWREALQAWSEEKLVKRSWRYMAPVLANLPGTDLPSLDHGVSWWLQSIAKSFTDHEAIFFDLCRRVFGIDYEESTESNDPVSRAINHPVGHATEALLRWWYRRTLEDGQGLPDEIKPLLVELCNAQIPKFRHGRVLLAAHVVALFRVDQKWALQYLLPLFDWNRSLIEARAAWEGFLWSPRLYRPLMEALKGPFLDTARHYELLGDHDEQYATLLTFAALDSVELFSVMELANATRALPNAGLHYCVRALVQAVGGAGEQRADYWTNRVLPYLRSIWPKALANLSPEISENFATLCVESQAAFPVALDSLRPWLQPVQHPDYLVHRLHDTNTCKLFPDAALTFLNLVIADNAGWPPGDLKACLEALRVANQQLTTDDRFLRLITYLRRHGRD